MDVKEFIEAAMEQTRQTTLRVVEGLDKEQLRWRPGPETNSIGFLLWHIGRVEDYWINRFTRQQKEVWEEQGWYQRFGGPLRDTGYQYDPKATDNIPIPPLDQLLAYLAAVRQETLNYLRGLDEPQLKQIPNPNRPEFTIDRVFRQFILHENQHAGAIEYLRGWMVKT